MDLDSLEALLIDQLKDLYSAENQLLKALPKMAKAAQNPQAQFNLFVLPLGLLYRRPPSSPRPAAPARRRSGNRGNRR